MSTGEFDPVESDRRDEEPTRFEPIKEEDESDELPVEKKEETPVMQRNESVKSTGEFDPVESNREEIPLAPPAVGATQISAAVPAKSVRSSGEFDPVESERKDETPASKNPAELTDTVVFSEIPENPAVSVEEVASCSSTGNTSNTGASGGDDSLGGREQCRIAANDQFRAEFGRFAVYGGDAGGAFGGEQGDGDQAKGWAGEGRRRRREGQFDSGEED